MKLSNDDDIATVDNIFLGPKGWLLPWRARFISYGIGLALSIVALALERRFGIRPGIWSIVFTLVSVVILTQFIGRFISHEMPLRALAQIFWYEVTAPRPLSNEEHSSMRPGKVKNKWKGITTHESRY